MPLVDVRAHHIPLRHTHEVFCCLAYAPLHEWEHEKFGNSDVPTTCFPPVHWKDTFFDRRWFQIDAR